VEIRFVLRIRELMSFLIPGLDQLFLRYGQSDDWRVVLATLPYAIIVSLGRQCNGRFLQ